MKIEIRPIEKKTWHGKTGKENFTRTKVIRPLVDANVMEYKTGLTEEEVEEISNKLSVDLSPQFHPETPHPVWDGPIGEVKLQNVPQFFDTDKVMDKLKYKICLESKYVANSLEDYEKGLFPDAHHVIFNEELSAEVKAKKVEKVNLAISKLADLSKERKKQLLFTVMGKNYNEASDSMITVAVDGMIKNEVDLLLRHLEYDPEFIETLAIVEECLQKQVLVKKGHKIMYVDAHLGDDKTSVARYLNKAENQQLKLVLYDKVIN